MSLVKSRAKEVPGRILDLPHHEQGPWRVETAELVYWLAADCAHLVLFWPLTPAPSSSLLGP